MNMITKALIMSVAQTNLIHFNEQGAAMKIGWGRYH